MLYVYNFSIHNQVLIVSFQIEVKIIQEAELAKEKTHGYKLDRSHIFAVNKFDDIEKFMKVPDEWALPEFKPYTPGVIFYIISILVSYLLTLVFDFKH